MTRSKASIISGLILLLLLGCSSASEDQSKTTSIETRVNRNFKYSFFANDIFPWLDGTKSGVIKPEKRNHALALERLIGRSSDELQLSLYGVQDQPWFIEALDLEKDRVVFAVVDQEKGQLNDWIPENFNYRDTAELGNRLGDAAITPDLNPSGTPRTSSIMHNKFIVFKNKGVWTGSTNLSATCIGSEYNANVAINIDSPELAQAYSTEFEQMFSDKKFSRFKQSAGGTSLSFRDGTKLSLFFSPQDNVVVDAVIPLIEGARSSLDVGMFVLSHPGIISSLKEAAGRGVEVRIILDALAAARETSPVKDLRAAGVQVRIENWGGKMHMKAAVADEKTVVIGSMNWTVAGELENDENTLVISNQKLATEMAEYFQNLWTSLDNLGNKYISAESATSINSCFDGIDNDYDGVIDLNEPLCSGAIQ